MVCGRPAGRGRGGGSVHTNEGRSDPSCRNGRPQSKVHWAACEEKQPPPHCASPPLQTHDPAGQYGRRLGDRMCSVV